MTKVTLWQLTGTVLFGLVAVIMSSTGNATTSLTLMAAVLVLAAVVLGRSTVPAFVTKSAWFFAVIVFWALAEFIAIALFRGNAGGDVTVLAFYNTRTLFLPFGAAYFLLGLPLIAWLKRGSRYRWLGVVWLMCLEIIWLLFGWLDWTAGIWPMILAIVAVLLLASAAYLVARPAKSEPVRPVAQPV